MILRQSHTHQKTRLSAPKHNKSLRVSHLYHFRASFSFSFPTSQHCTGVHGRGGNIKAGFFALFHDSRGFPRNFGAGALPARGYSTHRKIAHRRGMALAAEAKPHNTKPARPNELAAEHPFPWGSRAQHKKDRGLWGREAAERLLERHLVPREMGRQGS